MHGSVGTCQWVEVYLEEYFCVFPINSIFLYKHGDLF